MPHHGPVEPVRPGAIVPIALIVGVGWLTMLARGQQLAAAPVPASTAASQPTPAPAAPAQLPTIAVVSPPSGAFALGAKGPVGCPIAMVRGQVVMTQGYGVGSHAPADIWGAVDLAVDDNGDGGADPDASWGATIVATHPGVATATPNSHPAGNHVWIVGDGGWKTGYSHLAEILVATGDQVQAGQPIGLLGSTGQSSGPHLDYQMWHDGVNVDPTPLVDC